MTTHTTLTASDYEMQGITEQLGGLWNLLKLLKGVNLSKLTALFTALRKFAAADGLKAQIQAALDVLKVGVGLTETTADDKLIAVIDSALRPEVLDVIVGIITNMTPSTVAFTDETMAADKAFAAKQAEVVAQGIPLSFLVRIAMELITLRDFLLPLLQPKNSAAESTLGALMVPPSDDVEALASIGAGCRGDVCDA